MAIFTSSDSNYLTRANPWASSLGDNLTMCCWARWDDLAQSYCCPMSIDDGSDQNYIYFEYESAFSRIGFYCKAGGTDWAGSGELLLAEPVQGTWYFVAYVINGATDNHYAYMGRASDASLATASYVGGFSALPNTVDIVYGRDTAFTTEFLYGAVAHGKVWDAALSAAEINQEWRSIRPRRLADLKAWHPLMGSTVANSLADYSGNGFTLTQVGTPTVQDGPPVGWGAAPLVVASGVTGVVSRNPVSMGFELR